MSNSSKTSSQQWLKTRSEWIKENPPNHQNQYVCGICSKSVSSDSFELDHILPRRGDNIFDFSNLQPAHSLCNRLKGSRRLTPKVTKSEYQLRKELDL